MTVQFRGATVPVYTQNNSGYQGITQPAMNIQTPSAASLAYESQGSVFSSPMQGSSSGASSGNSLNVMA